MKPDNDVRRRLSTEAFRSWLPIVLSLCAITLTAYQASATRRHNRLSVQPRLDWQVTVDRLGGVTYKLVNDGFGPAELNNLDLLFDGKVIGPDGLESCMKVNELLGRSDDDWETSCFDMEGGYILRAGDKVTVFASIAKEGGPGIGRPLVASDYLRITVAGEYCSFYDDCWQLLKD